MHLSNDINILVYERIKVLCMHDELYYHDNNILVELSEYIHNNKKNKDYKFSLLNIIRKAIDYNKNK